jgi:hypothetical protein
MATSFPTGLDALTNPTGSSSLTSPDHAGQHADANDAIESLQAKVGVNGSAVTSSLDYKIERAINSSVYKQCHDRTMGKYCRNPEWFVDC